MVHSARSFQEHSEHQFVVSVQWHALLFTERTRIAVMASA